ncbi:S8 family serine peptidase [Bdellovibrio sp. HCB337]|uniref:S8 family serine peptidase n=1 Tax=Bdellovibrio sp. HCB337 TaxID=3394358 RepID=UPI0039A65D15
MKKHILGLNIAITGLAFWISACDPLISQNPKDTFWDKKFPKQLEWIRSQMREIPLKNQEKIVERVKKDQQRKDLLKVAVIDSGVDVAHTDLINQIDYRIEDGRIVGAGYDIMGEGRFGSHVLVDPTLFAFGAEALRDGRIVTPPESPLQILEQMNNRFRDLIMQGIQADPLLKASLFAKLNRDSFTALGFEYEKRNPKEYLESYAENKTKGELISATTPAEGRKKESILNIQNSWNSMTDDHTPDALRNIGNIEHGDRFIELLTKTYETLDKEMDFTKRIALFVEFKNTLERKDDVKEDTDRFPDELKKAMEFVVLGADMYDPIRKLERLFKSNREYQDMSFADAFRKYQAEQVAKLETLLKRTDLDKKDRLVLEKNKLQMEIFANVVENLISIEKDPVAYTKMRSDLRRYVFRTKHPYIAKESNDNSHGTHVSGVIAKQHPNIRIVPIRVTTQTINVAKDRQKQIIDKMLAEVKLFMESPYYQPLKAEIAREYGNLKLADSTIVSEVKKYLNKNALNAVFIQDVLNAVEAAGKDQVKLANVSLGTTFQKNHSLSQKKASMVEDIFSEFARFKIGQTIKEKAPGTLFMIATGNDGGWIDGVSKSAFPVGITSTRLIKIAQERGLNPSPNNTAKNVLAVASINPNGTLTPFTNILLDPNIPQIFSTGEEIHSSVPAKSESAAETIVRQKLQKLNLLLITMSQIESKDQKDLPLEERLEKMGKGMVDMKFMLELPGSLAVLNHIQDPINRANMSGTSMATPTVTGVIARYVAERMAKENITSDQVYNHPSFTPEKIINDVMAMSRSSALTPMITVKMLVDGIKTWGKSKGEITQPKAAGRFVKPRCEGVFAM